MFPDNLPITSLQESQQFTFVITSSELWIQMEMVSWISRFGINTRSGVDKVKPKVGFMSSL